MKRIFVDTGAWYAVVDKKDPDHKQAELYLRQAITIFETTVGNQHPDIAISLANLGSLFHNLKRFDDAEDCYKRALGIREKLQVNNVIDQSLLLELFGSLLLEKKQADLAEPIFKKAIDILESDENLHTHQLKNLLGQYCGILLQLGRDNEQVKSIKYKLEQLESKH